MFKELILAIALGALLGFGITGSYLAIKKNNSDKLPVVVAISPTSAISGSPQLTPEITQADQNNTSKNQLTIDSPENESVVTNSQITIKGTTNKLSSVIITTPIKTYYTNADNSGNFSNSIEIESGINQIQIDSIDPLDNQATTQILVTYSTAKF